MKGVFFLHIHRWQFPTYWSHLKYRRIAGIKPVYYVRIANAHIFYFFCFEIVIGADWAKPYVKAYGETDCMKTNNTMTKFLYQVRGKDGAIVYSCRFG